MRILSAFLIFINIRFLFEEKKKSGKKFINLVASVLKSRKIVTKNMIFCIFFLKLYIVTFLKKSDSERFSESFEFSIIRYKREPFRREAVEEEFQIEIISEMNIILYFHLNLA